MAARRSALLERELLLQARLRVRVRVTGCGLGLGSGLGLGLELGLGLLIERALLLQVTASAAALLHGREDAQVAMRLALFPILEHLGDETTLLSSAAELTLCRLCRGAAHEAPLRSVRALLQRNGDYLLDAYPLPLTPYPYPYPYPYSYSYP